MNFVLTRVQAIPIFTLSFCTSLPLFSPSSDWGRGDQARVCLLKHQVYWRPFLAPCLQLDVHLIGGVAWTPSRFGTMILEARHRHRCWCTYVRYGTLGGCGISLAPARHPSSCGLPVYGRARDPSDHRAMRTVGRAPVIFPLLWWEGVGCVRYALGIAVPRPVGVVPLVCSRSRAPTR